MGLCFSCFCNFMERKRSFHLSVLICQKPQSRREWEGVILLTQSVLKACSFLCTASPKSRGLNRVPKGSVEGVLQGPLGCWGKRKGESFVNAHFSSILHIDISWCLTNAKKKEIFLSLLKSIWLLDCIHLDKRKYSENVHHYKNDDCINIIHLAQSTSQATDP